MARCLIVACGCRGRTLARELRAGGHAVRGTTRELQRRVAIEAAGAEAVIGDPGRVATIAPALEHVSVVCLLLGSVTGSPENVRALHETRLEMLLQRMLDTTVRGLIYEVAGSVERPVLRAGAEIVRDLCVKSRIPYVLLDEDPIDPAAWLRAATDAFDRVLDAR